ncbi:hypothetical protein ACHAPJ_009761 [Fusarium lateritium]
MSSTMRAVAQLGQAYNVSVIDIPVPTIVNDTDVIVRINMSAICGSDLHQYHTENGSPDQPYVLGHEAIGYITQVGDAVEYLEVGDYVVIPDVIDNGRFTYEPYHYATDEPMTFGGAVDTPGLLPGLQTEYARVPLADHSLIPVPLNATHNTTTMLEYLFVSDIWATAWSGISWSGFIPGDTVAVFGAGPVGQLAAYSAILRGASRVYSVDHVQERLDLAASIGAIPINFKESDVVAQILTAEPGGVRRAIDAVGFEAENAQGEVDSEIILRSLVTVTGQRGGIGIVGVYNNATDLDYGTAYNKRVTINGGIALPLEVASELVPLVNSGIAKPGFIVSSIINIEDAPEYYRRFDRRQETKVVIKF